MTVQYLDSNTIYILFEVFIIVLKYSSTLSNSNTIPLDVDITVLYIHLELEQQVGEEITTLKTREGTICKKDQDNNNVRYNGRLIFDGFICLQITLGSYILDLLVRGQNLMTWFS